MAYEKMNPEVKAKWIAALRSGEYQQTKNFLCDGTGYCCLGVLCEVLNIPKIRQQHIIGYKFSNDLIMSGALAGGINRQINLESSSEIILTKMNDEENKSFSEIADWIEQNL